MSYYFNSSDPIILRDEDKRFSIVCTKLDDSGERTYLEHIQLDTSTEPEKEFQSICLIDYGSIILLDAECELWFQENPESGSPLRKVSNPSQHYLVSVKSFSTERFCGITSSSDLYCFSFTLSNFSVGQEPLLVSRNVDSFVVNGTSIFFITEGCIKSLTLVRNNDVDTVYRWNILTGQTPVKISSSDQFFSFIDSEGCVYFADTNRPRVVGNDISLEFAKIDIEGYALSIEMKGKYIFVLTNENKLFFCDLHGETRNKAIELLPNFAITRFFVTYKEKSESINLLVETQERYFYAQKVDGKNPRNTLRYPLVVVGITLEPTVKRPKSFM